MILFVLGLYLLQSRGYLLVRGGLGTQHQKRLGDKMVGIAAATRGVWVKHVFGGPNNFHLGDLKIRCRGAPEWRSLLNDQLLILAWVMVLG